MQDIQSLAPSDSNTQNHETKTSSSPSDSNTQNHVTKTASSPSDSNAQTHETKIASFADLVKGKKPYMLTNSDLQTLPDAIFFQDEPVLDLPPEFTQEGRDIFQFSLIGRLNFRGLKLFEVQRILEEQWKIGDGRCKLVPLTRGFFIIKLTTAEDKEGYGMEIQG